jgi:hypothetical protein
VSRLPPMEGHAAFSFDRCFRYVLERRWGEPPRRKADTVAFIMLNPSVADAERLDPTVRRCCGFAYDWGYKRLLVGNACALITTDPRALRTAPDAIGGPENDRALSWIASHSALVILAWGAHLSRTRAQAVVEIVRRAGATPHCLGVTAKGAPKHPLYLSSETQPTPYPPPGAFRGHPAGLGADPDRTWGDAV